jgi:hypothetical protein
VSDFPYTDERVDEIITQAEEWADSFWHGRHSPHGDHGPILAVTELAKAYRRERGTNVEVVPIGDDDWVLVEELLADPNVIAVIRKVDCDPA